MELNIKNTSIYPSDASEVPSILDREGVNWKTSRICP